MLRYYYFCWTLFFVSLQICVSLSVQCQHINSHYQKKQFDTCDIASWPEVRVTNPQVAISDDGNYVAYSLGSLQRPPIGYIKKTAGELIDSFREVRQLQFCKLSHHVIVTFSKDSLCLLDVRTLKKDFFPAVRMFRLFKQNSEEWMMILFKNGILLSINLKTRNRCTHTGVHQFYTYDGGAHCILLKNLDGKDDLVLQMLNVKFNKMQPLWQGKGIDQLIFSSSGKQIAFRTSNPDHTHSVWAGKCTPGQLKLIFSGHMAPGDKGYRINSLVNFSPDEQRLFLQIEPLKPARVLPGAKLNVWSYLDPKLQSQQIKELNISEIRLVVIDLQDFTLRALTEEGERPLTRWRSIWDDLVLIIKRKGHWSESNWNDSAKGALILKSSISGVQTEIDLKLPPSAQWALSPTSKFIIGYQSELDPTDVWSYEIGTGIYRNLTASIPSTMTADMSDEGRSARKKGVVPIGWAANEQFLLVSDGYDIWRIDPFAKVHPVRLTHAKEKQIRLVPFTNYEDAAQAVRRNQTMILYGCHEMTNQSSFCLINPYLKNSEKWHFQGDYQFVKATGNVWGDLAKANDVNMFLVGRESGTESRNLFLTADFASFLPVSLNHPERNFYWHNSQLVHFADRAGIATKGILYKPASFNAKSKYPVIIHYYDKKSKAANTFLTPRPGGGELDVNWFATHGYVVLVTDIHYQLDNPGAGILNAVLGAADYISQFPWVDSTKIGIQGHSFGGFETNYLISHSHRFAAAISSSGMTELIVDYLSIWPGGNAKSEIYELGQSRMPSRPWTNTRAYIDHSPILHIDSIQTPVLLIHNRNDSNVHFVQGVSFFIGLRRAGKVAWLLEYDNGGHGLTGIDYIDGLIRSYQFFNHYLKGEPAPVWMTKGIPARLKGREWGFEIDSAITSPPPGLTK
ncbi:prolyl oligopeptidase family protein [Chitinophaga sp. S165]|nr:prolyl oligopeptidase family protein [Chitinophaga sp. S165]